MKEYYPYTVIPEKVQSIIKNQIPLPNLPKPLPRPEKVKRGLIGTILFIISFISLIVINLISSHKYVIITYILLFITLITLVAMIFEFVKYGKLKKLYDKDLNYYNEHQKVTRKIKAEIESIKEANNDIDEVNNYRQKEIHTFFSMGYDSINAVHNEYSLAKKRFKLFLEEYFPDEILDNVKVLHRAKKINYVPDFIIQFETPKINIAIEIEEPYTLSNVPENIQKDYEAKDRLRQRFADELGWLVIILPEEQSVLNPTGCCRYIEDSMGEVLDDIRQNKKFANVQPLKKQKMLNGKDGAKLKANKYRETYLINAGLMDKAPNDETVKQDNNKIKKLNSTTEQTKTKTKQTNVANTKRVVIYSSNSNSQNDNDKAIITKPVQKENDQMKIIKKYANRGNNKKEGTESSKKVQDNKAKPITSKLDRNKLLDKDSEKGDNAKVSLSTNSNRINTSRVSGMKEDNANDNKTSDIKPKDTMKKNKDKDSVDEIIRRRKIEIENKLKSKIGQKVSSSNLSSNETKTSKQKSSKVEESVENTKELQKNKLGKTNEVKQSKPEISKNQKDVKDAKDKDLKQKDSVVKTDDKKVINDDKLNRTQTTKPTEDTQKSNINVSLVTKNNSRQQIPKEVDTLENKSEINKQAKSTIEDTNNNEIDKLNETRKLMNDKQELIDSYHKKLEAAVFDREWDKLIEISSQAIKELPFWGWAYYRRGTAYGNKKEFYKVILDCDKAIGYNPTLAEAYYNRATARYFLQDYMYALKDYEKAITLNYVKKDEAFYNKGLCLLKMHNNKRAFNEFKQAKKLGYQKATEILAQDIFKNL